MLSTNNWQKMKTAPRDETSIDIWVRDEENGHEFRYTNCWYCPDSQDFIGRDEGDSFENLGLTPVAWMPVPTKPEGF